MFSDFVKMVLYRKPDNVFDFTRSHFAKYVRYEFHPPAQPYPTKNDTTEAKDESLLRSEELIIQNQSDETQVESDAPIPATNETVPGELTHIPTSTDETQPENSQKAETIVQKDVNSIVEEDETSGTRPPTNDNHADYELTDTAEAVPHSNEMKELVNEDTETLEQSNMEVSGPLTQSNMEVSEPLTQSNMEASEPLSQSNMEVSEPSSAVNDVPLQEDAEALMDTNPAPTVASNPTEQE
jgi:hypothetical protein